MIVFVGDAALKVDTSPKHRRPKPSGLDERKKKKGKKITKKRKK